MRGGEASEEIEEGCPNTYKEKDDEEDDAVGGNMLRAPEVQPIATVRGRQEVVLDDDDDEEPLLCVRACFSTDLSRVKGEGVGSTHEDDFPPEQGHVEGRDFARCLAVVLWETNEKGHAD